MQEYEDRREQTPDENDPKTIEGGKRQTRRIFLWVLCGGYLLYLAYQLGSGYLKGEVNTGAERVISIVACVAFTIIGIVLLISAVRLWAKSFRESIRAMSQETEAPREPEALEAPEDEEEAAEADEETTE